jgi:cellulose synthase/poly-beta-1,6-N-acetylglucosamine synthase-like glycosyltransferase
MHNEEYVAADILEALVRSDYDPDLFEILAVDDRSKDATGAIIDRYAEQFPVIRPLHRTHGVGGKPAALEFATAQATGDIIFVFDADYVPGRAILKMLAAPFADPQVGAVMGRVVPSNSHKSLMAGLLALERAAGYQVNQQAHVGLGYVPLFGGTVGGVRASALRAVGGWNTRSLTEDTDLTCRLVLTGWKISYINRAECYEQVPQSWDVRHLQLRRWVIGHNDCFHRFGFRVLRSPFLKFGARLDLFLALASYWNAPILLLGWSVSVALFLAHRVVPADSLGLAILLIGCQMFSSQASLFEITSACYLDQDILRVLLLPMSLLNYIASTGTVLSALLTYYSRRLRRQGDFDWHKTVRYQNGGGNGNGDGNGNGNGNGHGNGNGLA